MKEASAKYGLNKLKQRYFIFKLMEIVLISIGISLLVYSVSSLFSLLNWTKVFAAVALGILSFLALAFRYQLHQLNDKSFTRFLNLHYPRLQESADLLLEDDAVLTHLQQLQKLKVAEQFNLIYPEIKLPHHVVRSAVIFTVCILISFLISAFSMTRNLADHKINFPDDIKSATDGTSAISLTSHTITVIPPDYTGKNKFNSLSFDLIFPEGSTITWQLNFSNKPQEVKMLFSAKDSVSFNTGNDYIIKKKIFQSGFYQLQWRSKNKIHRSDYFKIEVLNDEPPQVTIQNLNQFTKVKFNEVRPVELRSALSDDYGLTDALIVATVSKGSGESVKFREEKLRFTSPQKINGKQLMGIRSLDLKKMGLEPGDELYFYVQAWDNKVPLSNSNRTETFFIAIQDTTTEITSADSGLGVDLMPEYFRSQRQIIIDTDKLLRDKKRLSKIEFNSTSNELGYDQKVLRLRYGQFLGEEDESAVGQEAANHLEAEEDVTKPFVHQHDTQNEHNLVDQKKEEQKGKKSDKAEDPIKAFIHQHDNTEESTFFIQSIRAKLKAAVTIMWDAELYLRLYEPEKSLPYQYKALNLLKEISNDSRIYVHRTGFDPPPLKEEKRLTADLSEVKSNSIESEMISETDHPGIRQALMQVEEMLQTDSTHISPEMGNVFNKAAKELSVEAVEQPGFFLKSLSQLKLLLDGQVKRNQLRPILLQIRKSFWQILHWQSSSPGKQPATIHPLDQEFLKTFQQLKNE